MKLQSLYSLVSILALTLSCHQPAGTTATLTAPADLTVTDITTSSATLNWKGSSPEALGYYVLVSTSAEPVAKLDADSASYTFNDLEADTEFRLGVQAYGKGYALSQIAWAPTVKTLTPDLDPNPVEAVTFEWTEVGGLSLPESVRVFKTEGTLSGRPLQAWYASADCTGDIQLKVLFPGLDNRKTIDDQSASNSKCLVLVNGGIFGKFNNGLAVCDGEQTPWVRVEEDNWDIDRQYWGPDGKLHTVSRGMFGVNEKGVPGVWWSYTPSHGTVYVYDKPIPSVAGGPVQPGGTDTFPTTRAAWEPYNAITCGPVLLQSGKCPINDRKTQAGYWETNYELWADDIYGVNVLADRTAVGYRKDGSVILLIVDGRIDTSQGATTLEMAAIMKGLDCEGALNLDGGGSTGMWVKGGGHLNDTTGGNRAVLTTIGFFEK